MTKRASSGGLERIAKKATGRVGANKKVDQSAMTNKVTSSGDVMCALCDAVGGPNVKWASVEVDPTAPTKDVRCTENKCLDCHQFHLSTKPWLPFESFADEYHDDQDKMEERNLAVRIRNGEQCPWHQNAVDNVTTCGITVRRQGTFLDRTEFKAKYRIFPDEASIQQCEVPGDFGGKPVRGVLLMGVHWPEYRQVSFDVSSSTTRTEKAMPSQFHVVSDQDKATFDREVGVRKDAKFAAWKHGLSSKALTVANVEEKLAAHAKTIDQSANPARTTGNGVKLAISSVPMAASTLESLGNIAKQKKRVEDAATAVELKVSPFKSVCGSSVLGSDDRDDLGVDTWMAKLPLSSILGGWKPGRLTGHAETRADNLLSSEATRAEGKRLKNYLELVEVARGLRPDTVPLMDLNEMQGRIKKLSRCDITFPSMLKEAILIKSVTSDIAKFISGPAIKEKAKALMEVLLPWGDEAAIEFDPMNTKLCAMDGSKADLGVLFMRVICQDTPSNHDVSLGTLVCALSSCQFHGRFVIPNVSCFFFEQAPRICDP